MSESLFSTASDVKPGQVWINTELEKSGVPDPMTKVRVRSIEIGMVITESAVFRDSGRTEPVRIDTFRKKFRLEEEPG